MIEYPKKGDEIILVSSNNGTQAIEGQILKVVGVFNKNSTNPHATVSVVEQIAGLAGQWTIYLARDEWTFATKEKRVEYWTKKVEALEKQLDEAKDELLFHQKYDCEEEFLADKIEELLAPGKTKKNKVEVLKLLTKRFKK